jgi:hypothetical protein
MIYSEVPADIKEKKKALILLVKEFFRKYKIMHV